VGGLLSKSIAIVLPALGGAYLVWSRRRPIASRGEGGAASLSWTGIAATLAGPAAVGLAYVVVTRAIIGKAMLEPVRSLVSHYATQIKALPYYAATAALPVHLSVEPQFAVSQAPGETAVALAGLAALSLGLVVAAGWRRGWLEAFGAVWFFLALAPSAAVPLNVLVNEHRLYLPMVGASLALAHLVARARCPAWVPLAGLAIMVALTFQRNRVWRTEETLWGDAVATGPAMSRSHLNLGKAYLEQERYEEAIASSRRSLAIDPDLDRAHYNIGTAYLSQRQFEAAVASYERALEINPRLMEAVNNLGNAYKEQGLYEAALDQYRQALALADHGAIHHNLGSAFLAAGQRDSAIAHFNASIERDPDNRTAYEGLVRAHLQGDELERAAAVLARASSRWPRAVDMALLHGDVQAALGRDTEALARYLLGGLSDGAARLRLGSQARRRGDWARARRHYEEALQTEPDNARLHNALGEAHHAAGQTREALREYRRAAELAPDFAEAYANIGLVYVQNRRPVEAVAALERAVSLDPGQDLAWGLLGRARGELGRAAEAVAAYERAVELAPQKAEHWSDLAALHQEAGAAAAAEAAYRAALSRDPGLTRARYGLGVSLVEQRRYAEGAAAIERALGQGYDRPEAHINLAAARLNLGQGRAALQAYEEFLERAPGDDPLRPRVQGQVRALRQRLEAEGGS